MKVTFFYSPEIEISRIKYTLKKADWYKDKGINVFIPEKFSEEKVKSEFDDEEYVIAKNKLQKEFEEIKDDFLKSLVSHFSKLPNEIKCHLTKYGTGGSYELPNKIIINIKVNQLKKPLIEIMKHEILHLLSEDYVKKNNLTHKEKEDYVNSLSKKIFGKK